VSCSDPRNQVVMCAVLTVQAYGALRERAVGGAAHVLRDTSPRLDLGRRVLQQAAEGPVSVSKRCHAAPTLCGYQGRLRVPPMAARPEGTPRTRTRRCINRAKRTARRGRTTPPEGGQLGNTTTRRRPSRRTCPTSIR